MLSAKEKSDFAQSARHQAARPKHATSGGVHVLPPPASNTAQVPDPDVLESQRYRAFLGTLSDLLFVIRKDGRIAEFQLPEDYDYSLAASELVGKSLRELLPSQLAQQAVYYLEKALRTGQPQILMGQLSVVGKPREFQARFMVCGNGEALALVRDVTDRKQLEKELVEISHREQTRIGQDLHDGLGQHLTGITFLTRALETKLNAKGLAEGAEAAEIGRLVLEALSQTRTLARGLFPVELESKGLVAALRELASTVESFSKISCTFECGEDFPKLNSVAEMHLFRLAQEAINNCVKHGKARHVALQLKRLDASRLTLSVDDDGVGIAKDSTQARGLGLRIMKYRAQKIGGALEIAPSVSGGTRVECTFAIAGET